MPKIILTLIIIFGSITVFSALFLLTFSIKNNNTLKVRIWINNNYDTLYKHLPSYSKMLWNPKRWTKKSWMAYIQKKIDDKW
jgi:hypothetical protein